MLEGIAITPHIICLPSACLVMRFCNDPKASQILMQAKLCVSENILVVPIPGPCALVSALSASGLTTDEFTFGNKLAKLNFGIYGILGSKMAVVMYDFVVGFLPKHSELRRKRLMVSADQTTTQIFYVAPHKLSQFLDESSSIFGDARC